MTLLSWLLREDPERRALTESAIPPNWAATSEAGVAVSERTALQHLTVYACVRILADAVASLPLDAYRRRGPTRQEVASAPGWVARPDSRWTRFEWLWQLVASLALRGNAFLYVMSRDPVTGYPTGLVPLHPDDVTVHGVDARGIPTGAALSYLVCGTPVDATEIVHLRRFVLPGSVIGISPIEQARQGIGLGLAAERFGARWFGESANPSSVLETDQALSGDAVTHLQKQWISSHGGRRHPAVLSGGVKWRPISITPEESQFLECVVPGTLFTMADGTRRAVERLRVGDRVMAWNGSKLEAAQVAAVGRPPVKPLVRIRTARGRELTATADHPVLGLHRLRTPGCRPIESDGRWIAMGELHVGAYVRVGLGSVAEHTDEMSAADAYFLGAMTGDGYIRAGGCSWTSAEPAVTARMWGAVAALGGSLSPRASTIDFDVLTGGVGRGGSRIRRLLNESGLVGSHSHTKRVPESVLRSGPRAWRAFLSAYFDADGSIRDRCGKQKPAAYFASTSRALLEDCQHVLALLEIQSAIYPMSTGGVESIRGQTVQARPSWGLYVMGISQLRLLAAELDLAHVEKRRRLAEFADAGPSRYRRCNFDFDRVVEVAELGAGETVGVEITGLHTHVTAGIITHNTRRFQRGEIAMLFGIPPHMIGDTERSTSWGQGIEAQGIGFVTYSLRPWLACIEDALSDLTPRGQFVRFNVGGLLRGDQKARYDAYNSARTAGWMSVNEIRALEDLPPIEGGDTYIQPLNYGPLGANPTAEQPDKENDPSGSADETA
ncbi:phage portal protein [Nocardia terpenica]|uniref:Phage portal protein n=1 Tax=Nocardia terpenica TaxID=455432 RepID=A0A291RC62_9NOCA|nr:phage portal protein [Nocardia terpenica]ATL65133.1 phage portal protein [Nocardia terpenica]